MKFQVLYFSATGNTERAVGILSRELAAAGHEVESLRVTKRAAAPGLSGIDRLIVAFPVLAKAPPVMFARFLKRLPRGERPGGEALPASVMAVDGGGGGYAGYRAADILLRRGYLVDSVVQAHYPANWSQVNGVFDEARAAKVQDEGDAAAASLGAALAADEPPLVKLRPGKDAMDLLMPGAYGLFGRRFLGKLYYADRDCSSCRLCERTCPASTIAIGPGKRAKPYWKLNCESCNRCINVCPEGAIVTSIGRIIALVAAIGGACWATIRAYRAFAYPLIVAGTSPALAAAIDAAAIIALVVLSHYLGIGPFDALVLRWLQRIPGLRRFFSWSFTKGKRRYLAEGFKPGRAD